MDLDEVGEPYRQDTGGKGSNGRKSHHPCKFGYCAYPADRSTGRNAFYINEGNTVFKKPTEVPLLSRWPSDKDLKDQYDDHKACCK